MAAARGAPIERYRRNAVDRAELIVALQSRIVGIYERKQLIELHFNVNALKSEGDEKEYHSKLYNNVSLTKSSTTAHIPVLSAKNSKTSVILIFILRCPMLVFSSADDRPTCLLFY